MIPYINQRLNSWADWLASGRRARGLGYPSQVAFLRLGGGTPARPGAPHLNEEAWEIDRAVRVLDSNLRSVVREVYTRVSTVETVARALGCSRDTIYARLHRAHVEIMGHLNDMAAGCFVGDEISLDNSDKVTMIRAT